MRFPASTYFGRGFRGMARRAMDAYIDNLQLPAEVTRDAQLLHSWEDLILRAFHEAPQRPGRPSTMAVHFKTSNTNPGAALRDAVYDWLAVGRIFLLGDLIEGAPWQPFFSALKEPNYHGYRAEVIAELNHPPTERTWPIIDNQAVLAERLLAPPAETIPPVGETKAAVGETIAPPRETITAPPAGEPPVEPAPCCKDYPFCPCPEIPKILPVKVVDEVKPRWRYKKPK